MSILNEEKPTSSPLTPEEAIQMLHNVRDQMYQSAEGIENPAERFRKKSDVCEKFAEEQINNKDRYKHIFKTELGSTYFVLQTGECFRIKKPEDASEWDLLQPLTQRVIFLDKNGIKKFLTLRRSPDFQEKLIGYTFSTVPLSLGITPFEFGILKSPKNPLIKFTETSDSLTLLGDQWGGFAGGLHYGHPVKEIIK